MTEVISLLKGLATATVCGLSLTLLASCASTTPATPVIPAEVQVPITVRCKAPNVDRPVWPLQTSTGTEPLDVLVRNALAEIELRKGYEEKLEAAVEACK